MIVWIFSSMMIWFWPFMPWRMSFFMAMFLIVIVMTVVSLCWLVTFLLVMMVTSIVFLCRTMMTLKLEQNRGFNGRINVWVYNVVSVSMA